MHYYEADNNRKGKRAGVIAVTAYIALLVLLFFLVRIDTEIPHGNEGILIDFGTTDDGSGTLRTSLASQTLPATVSDDIATQDFEDAPEVVQEHPDSRNAEMQTMTRQREVNQRALFPGQSAQSQTSDGDGTTAGNQGHPAGGEDGLRNGTGTGTEGHSFDLAGRHLAERLPNPLRVGDNKYGNVVIEITVNSKGEVVSALPIAQGSTTTDGELIRAATEAALKARFTPDDKNPLQKGKITYIFKLD